MSADIIAQVVIALAGFTAVFLSQSRSRDVRRWAPIFGALGQPAWFVTAWINAQWGVFALCFLYSFAWIRGLYNHWWLRQG